MKNIFFFSIFFFLFSSSNAFAEVIYKGYPETISSANNDDIQMSKEDSLQNILLIEQIEDKYFWSCAGLSGELTVVPERGKLIFMEVFGEETATIKIEPKYEKTDTLFHDYGSLNSTVKYLQKTECKYSQTSAKSINDETVVVYKGSIIK